MAISRSQKKIEVEPGNSGGRGWQRAPVTAARTDQSESGGQGGQLRVVMTHYPKIPPFKVIAQIVGHMSKDFLNHCL
jgi:hypothetical protein